METTTRFKQAMSEADSLIRPDGSLEPGYEGLALAVFEELVNAWREVDD